MNTTVTLDEAGRIALPQELRDQLRLTPGDTLELESEGEQLTLRRARSTSRLRKEQGVWVFRGGSTVSVGMAKDVLDEIRTARIHDVLKPMG